MATETRRAVWVALKVAAILVFGYVCFMLVMMKLLDGVGVENVEANVPEQGSFDRFMRRDLQSYLESAGYKPLLIHYEMLRDGPTQSGIAYPKFYVWLQADTGDGAFTEGVAQVEAVDKKEFAVKDFITIPDLAQNPGRACQTFPEPVCLEIQERIRAASGE